MKRLEFENKDKFFNAFQNMREHIPQWYKEAERFIGGKPRLQPEVNKALKLCMPFLDSLTTGYAICLTQDILVEKQLDGSSRLSWTIDNDVLISRSSAAASTLPIPTGHNAEHFAWKSPVAIRIPTGYQILFTHPLNRFDLPFTTLSGIVDGGWVLQGGGNIPFFLKNDFEGVIPQGTPIAQIIPLKTEPWESKEVQGTLEEGILNWLKSAAKISGWYKTTIWRKKTYQ